jgi:hypothetical protein
MMVNVNIGLTKTLKDIPHAPEISTIHRNKCIMLARGFLDN